MGFWFMVDYEGVFYFVLKWSMIGVFEEDRGDCLIGDSLVYL